MSKRQRPVIEHLLALIDLFQTDRAVPGCRSEDLLPEEEERILSLIAADPAIESPHNLRTRRIGQNIAVEVHIRVDGATSVTESHRLTVEIERRLRDAYGAGTMVSIHVEPRK